MILFLNARSKHLQNDTLLCSVLFRAHRRFERLQFLHKLIILPIPQNLYRLQRFIHRGFLHKTVKIVARMHRQKPDS